MDTELDNLLDRWTIQPLGRDLTGAILARARAEEADLDRLLDRAADVPAMRRDVAGAVLAAVRRHRRHRRLVAVLGTLAAAAAVAIAATVWTHMRPPTNVNTKPPTIAQLPPTLPTPAPLTGQERVIAENYDLVRDLPVLVHWDTIRAMEQLEAEREAAPDGRL